MIIKYFVENKIDGTKLLDLIEKDKHEFLQEMKDFVND